MANHLNMGKIIEKHSPLTSEGSCPLSMIKPKKLTVKSYILDQQNVENQPHFGPFTKKLKKTIKGI